MASWTEVEKWVAPVLDDEQLKQLASKVCPSCAREYEGVFVRCPSDQMTLTDVPSPKGMKLKDRYECSHKIGAGELFDVYEATDSESKKKFVVKVLRRDFECDQRALKQFEQEQMIVSSLKHHNVAGPVAFGALPEQYSLMPYTVVEFIDGVNLSSAMSQWGKLDASTAKRLMEQICEGFEAAHALGAVHGDFKPSNIYLTQNGDKQPLVKLVDFGVATRNFRLPQTGSRLSTNSTQSVTSAMYTAPEIHKGAMPNSAGDIYSIGCVFYELMAGEQPFKGTSSFELAYAHQNDEAPKLGETAGTAEFREALTKCVSKEPADRISIADLKKAVATLN